MDLAQISSEYSPIIRLISETFRTEEFWMRSLKEPQRRRIIGQRLNVTEITSNRKILEVAKHLAACGALDTDMRGGEMAVNVVQWYGNLAWYAKGYLVMRKVLHYGRLASPLLL
jgi:hypothetical protein